jgi:deoxyribose-phosphate aldolase
MLASKIDHTFLKPNGSGKDIIKLCQEAMEYGFRSVCVNSSWVKAASKFLQDAPFLGDQVTEIATVIGFPFGACSTEAKVSECIAARVAGATEFDVVWNIGLLKSGRPLDVMLELHTLVKIVHPLKVKVIVESGYLDAEEQEQAYNIIQDSGAQCIKTSTGYCPEDDLVKKLETVRLWKGLGDLEIKASGGIKSYDAAKMFLASGADILGTSSGVAIAEEYDSEAGKN